jgi:hypothetical protein
MSSSLKRMSFRHKNNKFTYYAGNYMRFLIPTALLQACRPRILAQIASFDRDVVEQRVNYYNRLTERKPLPKDAVFLKDLKLQKKCKVYYLDVFRYSKYFSQRLKGYFLFGDVIHVPHQPSIVKSRPIHGDIAHSVVMKLDKIRHFTFVNDTKLFSEKKDMMIGRGNINQEHRVRFFEMYFNHPMCNLGVVSRKKLHEEWKRPRMTLTEQLDYKFVMCIEGNDVASCLKWVMSSNCLAVMPKPKYETWFMEGTLIPNHHYVLIQDDYSDLEERMNYYIAHPDEAQKIIDNAHDYVRQFMNPRLENLISLMVLQKYFEKTDQF